MRPKSLFLMLLFICICFNTTLANNLTVNSSQRFKIIYKNKETGEIIPGGRFIVETSTSSSIYDVSKIYDTRNFPRNNFLVYPCIPSGYMYLSTPYFYREQDITNYPSTNGIKEIIFLLDDNRNKPAKVVHTDNKTNQIIPNGIVIFTSNTSTPNSPMKFYYSSPAHFHTRDNNYYYIRFMINDYQSPFGYKLSNITYTTYMDNSYFTTTYFRNEREKIPLNYTNATTGGEPLANVNYTGIRIGEYLWMDSNLNHAEPNWIWWTAEIGQEALKPITQNDLNKYLDRARLDRSYFQVDTADVRKYYGTYFSYPSFNYMRAYAKMYEGTERKLNGWQIASVKDYRQLFGMCPFLFNNHTNLTHIDVPSALGAKENDNVLAYNIGTSPYWIYWFQTTTNMYGFNMMPNGGRLSGVDFWYNTYGPIQGSWYGVEGDIYHMFYTVKLRAIDGTISIHDHIDVIPDEVEWTSHWMNIRWCRKLTNEELGYKLYIGAKTTDITSSSEWEQLMLGNELPLLRKVLSGSFSPENFIIKKTAVQDIPPSGYVELPNGYIRGFYVQHNISKPMYSTSDSQIMIYASSVQDRVLNGTYLQNNANTSPMMLKDATGVKELFKEINTIDSSIYPNPASDVIHFKGEFSKATLFNASGQMVLESTENPISVSGLNDGIYFIKIMTNSGVLTQKVIIKK